MIKLQTNIECLCMNSMHIDVHGEHGLCLDLQFNVSSLI